MKLNDFLNPKVFKNKPYIKTVPHCISTVEKYASFSP